MKAFEEKYGALYSAQECRDDYWGIKRETWKAALEWFKRNCHEATDAEGIPTGYLLIKSHVLEEELNES